jgi:hypothetical protein
MPFTNDKYVELFTTYPHIKTKLASVWGTVGGRALLIELLADSRNGARAGFSPANAKAIFALLAEHDTFYPEYDTSDEVVIPFKGAERPKVIVKVEHPSVFLIAVKIAVVFILIAMAAKAWVKGNLPLFF